MGYDFRAQLAAHRAAGNAGRRQVSRQSGAELVHISAHRNAQFDRAADLTIRDLQALEGPSLQQCLLQKGICVVFHSGADSSSRVSHRNGYQ